MTQNSVVDLQRDELSTMAEIAQQIVGRPGVAVSIPSQLVSRIEGAIQGTLNEALMLVRERERSQSSELLKLRFR